MNRLRFRLNSGGSGARRTLGTTLIEMLVYVAVMAVGVNLCASLFASSIRLSALGSEGLERIQGANEIEQAFRDTVRSADAIVPQYASHQSGPGRVVLRAGTVDGAARYIVLGALRDSSHLSKLEIIDRPDKPEASSFVTYSLPLESIQFEFPASSRMVVFSYSLKLDRGEPAARRAGGQAAAALRGMDTAGGAQ